MIIFTNYLDQTQAIDFQTPLLYNGCYVETPYPLLLTLSKSVEFEISLSKSIEFGVSLSKSVEFEISLSKSGGGNS